MEEAKLKGIITCPECSHKQEMEIPTNRCIAFYICDGCKKTISTTKSNCCVFCDYGDTPCPVSHEGKAKGIKG